MAAPDPWAGSVLPLQEPTYIALPLSRKTRRTLSESDEAILQELDRKEVSYRRGWPSLPALPLNTFTQRATDSIPNSQQCLQYLTNILQTHNITPMSVDFAFRLPDEAEDDALEDEEFLTLLVKLDMVQNEHRIQNALISLRRALKNHNSTSTVMIEIIDYRITSSGLKCLPVSVAHQDIIKAWEFAAPQIISNALKDKRWIVVECVLAGLNDTSTFSPTIYITSPNAREYDWYRNVIPTIYRYLRSQAFLSKFDVRFEVEVLQGMTVFSKPGGTRFPKKYAGTRVQDRLLDIAYDRETYMGASIGLEKDAKSTGTVGGCVQLKGKDASGKDMSLPFGLTNWHVVRNEELDKMVQKSPEGALFPKKFYKQLVARPQRIFSPSDYDHQVHINRLKIEVEQWKKSTQGDAKELLAKAEGQLKDIQKIGSSRFLGNVLAGSGRRTVYAYQYNLEPEVCKAKSLNLHRFPLDWALVQLTGSRLINNRIHIENRDFPTDLALKDHYTMLSDLRECQTWSHFRLKDEDINVAKFGRTSGWTFGCINAIMPMIKPEDDEAVAKAYGFTNENYGRCWAIGQRDHNWEYQFMRSGDSGSVCLYDPKEADKLSGTWLGLLFGVTKTGQGMMIPMDLVWKDIEEVCGYRVIIPKQGDSLNC